MADRPGGVDARAGLQRERTMLAWQRTAISLMVVGVLLGTFARSAPFGPRSLPAIVGVGTGMWVVWVTTARPGGLEWSDDRNRLRRKRTATVAIVAMLLGASGLVLVLLRSVGR